MVFGPYGGREYLSRRARGVVGDDVVDQGAALRGLDGDAGQKGNGTDAPGAEEDGQAPVPFRARCLTAPYGVARSQGRSSPRLSRSL